MLQRILSTLAVVAFCFVGTASMAADNSSIVGAWNMEVDIQGQPLPLTLMITESDEGLGGTVGSPDFGESVLSKVSFDGSSLTFTTDDQQGGMVDVTLELEDGDLTGKAATGTGDLPIVAKR